MKKKIFTILICGIIVLGLTGCGSPKNDINTDDKSVIEEIKNHISLSLKEGTLKDTGATFILKNDSNVDVQYGNPFWLEIKQDGKWQKIDVELNFTLIAYILKPKESKEFNIDFEDIYGKLSKGEYRFIKDIDIEKKDKTFENFNVTAEFTID